MTAPSTARGVPAVAEADAWRADAACVYEDSDAWFADARDREVVTRALSVCAGYPVLEACRDYAHRTRQAWGVWGGETAHQRGTAYVIKYSRL